jgi:YD repeat-containing protein
VDYTRDARGNIQAASMTHAGTITPLVSAASYRPDGLPTSRTFGNNLTDIRAYDTQGQLREMYLGSADTRLYAYDANGNLTGKQTLPEVGAYAYDALDRLKKEDRTTQATVTTNWTYDANGNRKTQNTGSYAYLANSNRLTTAAGSSISLDAAGNTLSDGTRSYTYNNAGQLSQVGSAGYSYNAQRQRSPQDCRFAGNGVSLRPHRKPDRGDRCQWQSDSRLRVAGRPAGRPGRCR